MQHEKLRFIVNQKEDKETLSIDVLISREQLFAKLRKLLLEIADDPALGYMFHFFGYPHEEYDEISEKIEADWKRLVAQGLKEDTLDEDQNFEREQIVANVRLTCEQLEYMQEIRQSLKTLQLTDERKHIFRIVSG